MFLSQLSPHRNAGSVLFRSRNLELRLVIGIERLGEFRNEEGENSGSLFIAGHLVSVNESVFSSTVPMHVEIKSKRSL